jgi:hypothetical protein
MTIGIWLEIWSNSKDMFADFRGVFARAPVFVPFFFGARFAASPCDVRLVIEASGQPYPSVRVCMLQVAATHLKQRNPLSQVPSIYDCLRVFTY